MPAQLHSTAMPSFSMVSHYSMVCICVCMRSVQAAYILLYQHAADVQLKAYCSQ